MTQTTSDTPNHQTRELATNGQERFTPPDPAYPLAYFNHPDIPGSAVCNRCGHIAQEHGWINTRDLYGITVCPSMAEGPFHPHHRGSRFTRCEHCDRERK